MRVITFQIPKFLSSVTRACLKFMTTNEPKKRVKKSKNKA